MGQTQAPTLTQTGHSFRIMRLTLAIRTRIFILDVSASAPDSDRLVAAIGFDVDKVGPSKSGDSCRNPKFG